MQKLAIRAILSGVSVAAILFALAVSSPVQRLRNSLSWMISGPHTIHTEVQFDNSGRLSSVIPYYMDSMGTRVVHGELIHFAWQPKIKTIFYYCDGKPQGFGLIAKVSSQG